MTPPPVEEPLRPPGPGRLARRLLGVLPIALTVGLGAALLTTFEGWDLLAGIAPGWLAVAIVVGVVGQLLSSTIRWWLVLRLSDAGLSYRALFRIHTGLLPVTFFAPFQSDFAVYALALRRTTPLTWFQAFENIFYERLCLLAGGFALVLAGQLVLPADHPLARPWIVAVAAAGVLLYFVDRPIARRLARLRWLEGRGRLLDRPIGLGTKVGLLLVSASAPARDVAVIAIALGALGVDAPLDVVIGAFPMVVVVAMAPVSVSGLGVREAMAGLVLGHAMTTDQAIAGALVLDFAAYVAPSLAGLVLLKPALGLVAPRRGSAPAGEGAEAGRQGAADDVEAGRDVAP